MGQRLQRAALAQGDTDTRAGPGPGRHQGGTSGENYDVLLTFDQSAPCRHHISTLTSAKNMIYRQRHIVQLYSYCPLPPSISSQYLILVGGGEWGRPWCHHMSAPPRSAPRPKYDLQPSAAASGLCLDPPRRGRKVALLTPARSENELCLSVSDSL